MTTTKEEEKDNFFKQNNLYNPNKDTQPKIIIYGCGSIGSHTAISLAKTGFKNIIIIDYDKVETSNIPAQFFTKESAGNLKTSEINNLSLFLTGTPICPITLKIDENYTPDLTENSIHIMALDNIETRKIILKGLKGRNVHLIDTRIGGFNYEKHYIKCDKNTDEYEKTLTGTFSETKCGEKCLWAVNTAISSLITADIIKISKKQRPNTLTKGHLMTTTKITK